MRNIEKRTSWRRTKATLLNYCCSPMLPKILLSSSPNKPGFSTHHSPPLLHTPFIPPYVPLADINPTIIIAPTLAFGDSIHNILRYNVNLKSRSIPLDHFPRRPRHPCTTRSSHTTLHSYLPKFKISRARECPVCEELETVKNYIPWCDCCRA